MLTIPCNAVKPGDRVLVVDDLIATGGAYMQRFESCFVALTACSGTTIAAANLIVEAGGVVAEATELAAALR